MEIKYTVIKNEDLKTYLTDNERNAFYHLIEDKIEYEKALKKARTADREAGSDHFYNPTPNTYIVINTDEPYANEIIEIMKKHGHWG